MNKELKADIIAAKLCGHEPYYCGSTVFTGGKVKSKSNPFTLSNPSDLMQTVIALGEKEGIGVMPDWNMREDRSFGWYTESVDCDIENGFDTYLEAVQAALLSLEES